MTAGARTILESALDLDDHVRADLAAQLLASLDTDLDDDAEVERAWANEVNQRARNVLDGTSATVDWDDIRTQLANRHHR